MYCTYMYVDIIEIKLVTLKQMHLLHMLHRPLLIEWEVYRKLL